MKYNIEKLDAILSDPNKSFAERIREFKAELENQHIVSSAELNTSLALQNAGSTAKDKK